MIPKSEKLAVSNMEQYVDVRQLYERLPMLLRLDLLLARQARQARSIV